MQPLSGVYNILTTPFTPDGAIDIPSLERLTRSTIEAGVTGITVLGVAGEAQKLNPEERRIVMSTVKSLAGKDLPIIAGTSHDGTDLTIEASREAQQMGAAGLMIAPPAFLQPGPGLTEHYRRIAEAVDIPIILQDFPVVNGVTMSPAQMVELCDAVPAITTIKLEDVPTPQRTAQTLRMTGRNISIVGGLGGMYLLDELRRGSSGAMTGFAYPEILVKICKAWLSGDRQRATELYYRVLPLLVFEGQPKLGVAIRKEILRRRGLIDHATLRHPGPSLDDGTLADLTETIEWVGIDQILNEE
ncbi:MAG: dihydrodipicolinate synthase family protein [Sphaerobacteraceae bacterium]|nr:MAG: dihydrodipicolinate synthase family protein [Sphaerobacteraceae bacterium]